MLDLAFVRDHLDLVEKKLRDRGMNPEAVLGDFHTIDQQRRSAITTAETLKAQRNKATEEIAQLKKNKQDATAQITETKELREKIAEAEKAAEEADARLRNILVGIPTCRTTASRSARAKKITLKSAAGASRRSSTSRPSRIGSWAKSSEYSIWSAQPRSLALGLRSTGIWVRG